MVRAHQIDPAFPSHLLSLEDFILTHSVSLHSVITSAPYPLNSLILVVIAIGVSNVILRAIEFGSRPDALIGFVTFAALLQFISEVFFNVSYVGNFFPYRESSRTASFFASFFGLALLTLLGYLSHLSHLFELQKTATSEIPDITFALEDIRRDIGLMKRKLASQRHQRQPPIRK